MKNSHDDNLDQLLRSATEVPFTDEQKRKILSAATELAQKKSASRHRRRDYRGWLVAFGGAAAALVLAVSIWRLGAPQLALDKGVSHSTASNANSTSTAISVQPGSVIGLRTAPVQVTKIRLTSSKPGGPKDEVVATIYNSGLAPIGKTDIVGVLAFGSGQTASNGILGNEDWLTFVNGPDNPIEPKQSTEWTFVPVTAPKDGNGNLTETPQLSFYQNAVSTVAEADATWQLADVTTTVNGVHVVNVNASANAQTTSILMTVQNQGTKPVDLSQVVAVVWFTPQGSNVDFLHPYVTRFLTHVKTSDLPTAVLQAGASEQLTFTLTGAADATLTGEVPHIVFVNPNS